MKPRFPRSTQAILWILQRQFSGTHFLKGLNAEKRAEGSARASMVSFSKTHFKMVFSWYLSKAWSFVSLYILYVTELRVILLDWIVGNRSCVIVSKRLLKMKRLSKICQKSVFSLTNGVFQVRLIPIQNVRESIINIELFCFWSAASQRHARCHSCLFSSGNHTVLDRKKRTFSKKVVRFSGFFKLHASATMLWGFVWKPLFCQKAFCASDCFRMVSSFVFGKEARKLWCFSNIIHIRELTTFIVEKPLFTKTKGSSPRAFSLRSHPKRKRPKWVEAHRYRDLFKRGSIEWTGGLRNKLQCWKGNGLVDQVIFFVQINFENRCGYGSATSGLLHDRKWLPNWRM